MIGLGTDGTSAGNMGKEELAADPADGCSCCTVPSVLGLVPLQLHTRPVSCAELPVVVDCVGATESQD